MPGLSPALNAARLSRDLTTRITTSAWQKSRNTKGNSCRGNEKRRRSRKPRKRMKRSRVRRRKSSQSLWVMMEIKRRMTNQRKKRPSQSTFPTTAHFLAGRRHQSQSWKSQEKLKMILATSRKRNYLNCFGKCTCNPPHTLSCLWIRRIETTSPLMMLSVRSFLKKRKSSGLMEISQITSAKYSWGDRGMVVFRFDGVLIGRVLISQSYSMNSFWWGLGFRV